MRIDSPDKKKKKRFPVLLLLILVLSLALGGAYAYVYLMPPHPIPPFEIQSFIGKVEIKTAAQSAGTEPKRGGLLQIGDWVMTGPEGEIDLKFGNAYMRVKENSEVAIEAPQFLSKAKARVHLQKGIVLNISNQEPLQITVPGKPSGRRTKGLIYDLFLKLAAFFNQGAYLVGYDQEIDEAWISVLQGSVNVHSQFPWPSHTIKELETSYQHKDDKVMAPPAPIAYEEWSKVKETYELLPTRSAAEEAKQLDLAKQAGNFFQYAFDHGTFYQKKWGHCDREFIMDERVDKDGVYMRAIYDVFPRGSWVGVYVLTRNFDLAKFNLFKVDARRAAGHSFPDLVRIELKSRYQVIRAFALKNIETDWGTFEFPLNVQKSTPITEVTFIFSNDKVGTQKSGALELKNFTLQAAPPKPQETAADGSLQEVPTQVELTDLSQGYRDQEAAKATTSKAPAPAGSPAAPATAAAKAAAPPSAPRVINVPKPRKVVDEDAIQQVDLSSLPTTE